FDGNQAYGPPDLLTGLLDVTTLLKGEPRAYATSVLTNVKPGSFATELRHRPAGPMCIRWHTSRCLSNPTIPFTATAPDQICRLINC
ncbi:MAG: hypothetical protein AAF754_12910, partial [Pseudomonadota bacterium]